MKQEERQPYALTSALLADKVHAVIPVAAPHERQSVAAKAQAVFEGADACLTPVLDMQEALQHPHNVARNTFAEVDGAREADPPMASSGGRLRHLHV